MAITVSTLTDGQTYKDSVPLTVVVTGTTPTAVGVQIGRYLWPATRVGSTTSWSAAAWDTRMKEGYQTEASPSNHAVYVRGYATVGGVVQYGDWIMVFTGNIVYSTSSGGTLPAGGYRAATAFEDDLTSKSTFLAKYAAPVIGQKFATVGPDPLVSGRNAVLVTLPDTAWQEPDMPAGTTNPRYQAQSPSVFREGDEAYFAWPFMIPTTNSSAVGAGGFPDVGVSALQSGKPGSGKHIALMQIYGPQATNTQYPSGTGTDQRGAITNLDANRSYEADPLGVFQIGGNQLNPGFPADLLEIPYNRGKWTDIGIGIHFSADVKRGWIELYVNQGDGRGLRPYEFFDGRTRLPYVGLWPMKSTPSLDTAVAVGGSYNHRLDRQIYRTRGVYPEVTMWHGALKIGPTIASVDPLSYATLDVQAPTGPTLTNDAPSHDSVTLRFSGATDNVGVTSLIVRRSGKVLATLPPTATSYTDTTVDPSTEYKYAIVATDAVPLEGRSNTITVLTKAAPDQSPPSAPVVTVSEVTSTSARLTWPASTDNVGVAGYRVEKGGALLADQTALTIVVTGLAPSSTTFGTVAAFDAVPNFSESATWTITTTAAPATTPAAPSGLVAVTAVTASSASVSWNASPGATGYRVYLDGAVAATSTTPNADLSELTQLTPYTVTVTALGVGTESAPSTAASFTTLKGDTIMARPTRVASFGPNGTHYPTDTGWVGDAFDTTITATACTWAAIKTAIDACVARPVGEKTRVLVPAGTLVGTTSGSGAVPALQSAGSLARTWNVLVMPQGSRGSVKTDTKGTRLHDLKGITFWGIDNELSWTITGSQRVNWCWSIGQFFNVVGAAGFTTDDIGLYECVTPNAIVFDGDTWGWRGFGSPISNVNGYGCYIAGTQRPAGEDTHTDGLQFSSYGDGSTYHDMGLHDSAIWTATNQAVQSGVARNVTWDHVLMVAEQKHFVRYPPIPKTGSTPAGDAGVFANAINGGTTETAYGATVKDCILVGSIYNIGGTAYKTFSGTRTTYDGARPIASDGTIATKDVSYRSWSNAQYETICPTPTLTYLNKVWSITGGTTPPPVDPPVSTTPLTDENTLVNRIAEWRKAGALRILMHGADEVEGGGADSLQSGWAAQLIRRARNQWYPSMDAFPSEWVPAYVTSVMAADPGYAKSAMTATPSTVVKSSTYGLGRKSLNLASGQVASVSRDMTDVGINVFVVAGGSYQVRVNGVLGQTFTPAEGWWAVEVKGLTRGLHDVAIISRSPVNTIYVSGAMVWRGSYSSGPAIFVSAKRGSSAAQFLDGGGTNSAGVAVAGDGTWQREIAIVKPQIVILAHGTHDVSADTLRQTSPQFEATVRKEIAQFKPRVRSDGIFLLQLPQEKTPGSLPPIEPWQNYVDALKRIAANTANVWVEPISDHVARMDPGSAKAAQYMFDATHPNDDGYDQYAAVTMNTLMGVYSPAAGADATPPAVTWSSPAAGSSQSGTNVVFTGTATDTNGIKSVTWRHQETGALLATGVLTTGSTYSATVPRTALPTGTLPVMMVVTDNSGRDNTASIVRSFTVTVPPPPVDTTVPDVDLVAPVAGGTLTDPQTFTATAAAASGITAVSFVGVTTAGATVQLGAGQLVAGTTLSGTYSLTKTRGSLPPTLTKVYAVASSGNGKTSSTAQITVVLPATADTKAPDVTPLLPVSGTQLTGQIEFRGRAADNVATAAAWWEYNGTTIALGENPSGDGVTWTKMVDRAALPAGMDEYVFVAQDAVPNRARSAAVPVTLAPLNDSTPPVISSILPAANATLPETVQFRATVVDLQSGVKSGGVAFYANPGGALLGGALKISGDVYGIDVPRGALEGFTSFWVEARNNQEGLATSAAVALDVPEPVDPADLDPVGQITAPFPGPVLSIVGFRANWVAPRGLASVEFRVGTVTLGLADDLGRGVWGLDVIRALIPFDSSYEADVYARATDTSGVVVDTAPITITTVGSSLGLVEIRGPRLDSAGRRSNGEVWVRAGAEFQGVNGRVTQTVHKALIIDGGFYFEDRATPLTLDRPPAMDTDGASIYYEWVERVVTQDGQMAPPITRHVIFGPTLAAAGSVDYNNPAEFIDIVPMQTQLWTMPSWYSDIAAVTADLTAAKATADAAKVTADKAQAAAERAEAAVAATFTVIQDIDGVFYPASPTKG